MAAADVTWESETGRLGCQCLRSDAWRCNNERRARGIALGSIGCPCECHRYVHTAAAAAERERAAGQGKVITGNDPERPDSPPHDHGFWKGAPCPVCTGRADPLLSLSQQLAGVIGQLERAVAPGTLSEMVAQCIADRAALLERQRVQVQPRRDCGRLSDELVEHVTQGLLDGVVKVLRAAEAAMMPSPVPADGTNAAVPKP